MDSTFLSSRAVFRESCCWNLRMSMSKRTCSSSSCSHVQRHTGQPLDVRRHTCEAYSLCCLMPRLTRIMRAALAHNIVASTHSSGQLRVAWSLYGMALSRTVYLLALNVHGYLLALNVSDRLNPAGIGSILTYTCVCLPPSYTCTAQRNRVLTLGLKYPFPR